jgi:hypothetical protein
MRPRDLAPLLMMLDEIAGSDGSPESCAASSDAARAPHRHAARKATALLEHARCRRGDARGLVVAPGCQLRRPTAESWSAKPCAARVIVETDRIVVGKRLKDTIVKVLGAPLCGP